MDDQKCIRHLQVRNFVGIEDLDVAPGKVNIIRGRIGRGKTSVLKAISELLAGGGKHPELVRVTPDNDGAATKAEIMADLGDVAVSRSITAKGSYLKVDGLPKGDTEAAFLGRIVNPLSFNPVAFYQAKPAERRAMLLSLVPCSLGAEQVTADYVADIAGQVDCSQHGLEAAAALEKVLVEQRRAANSVTDERRARADVLASQVPGDFDADKWRTADASSLNEQIRAAGAAENEQQGRRQRLTDAQNLLSHKREKIADLEKRLADLRASVTADEANITALVAEIDSTVLPDASQAEADLAAYTEAQGHLRAYDNAQDARELLAQAEQNAARLNTLVEKARALPGQMLAGATLPIEGLSITPDDVLLNGVSIDQLSTGEQLLFALNVARASVGDALPVILIDRAESLDPQSFELLMAEMQRDDFQYFVTRVDGAEQLTIDIDAGAVGHLGEEVA